MLHHDLLRQASILLALDADGLTDVNWRRAISSAYYAVFHAIGHVVSHDMLGSEVETSNLRALVRRSLSHVDLNEALKGYASGNLRPLYKQIVGEVKNSDLQIVASSFKTLQAHRHKADYDVAWQATALSVQLMIDEAREAIAALERLSTNPDEVLFQKMFTVSMFFHKNLKGRE